MMSTITMIGPGGVGNRTVPGEPVQEIIDCLEDMLTDAREGILVGLVIGKVFDRSGVVAVDTDAAWRGDRAADLAAALLLVQQRGIYLIGYTDD